MQKANYEQQYVKEIAIGDQTVTVTIGKFSEQASAAVLLRCGDTVVHTTVALGRKVSLDYFPLSVEFIEKLYAGGIIKGSRWVKREGKPSDEAVLKARVIDRTMRPLFPDNIRNEVQIINTVFSYDGENEPDMLALLGSAIGLAISDIPFDGPIAGLRVGYQKQNKKFILNPRKQEMAESDLDLIVSATADSIVMVEAGANEISEDVMIDALEAAQTACAAICTDIEEITAAVGKNKATLVEEADPEEVAFMENLTADIEKKYSADIAEIIKKRAHLQESNFSELLERIVDEHSEGTDGLEEMLYVADESRVETVLYSLMKKQARQMILTDEIRPDGRKLNEIRPIWCEVDVFPRTHGSAMFKRGATQAVTIVTLGSPAMGQHMEDLNGEEVKHYMHFYNMPPYASGEAGRMGWPKRREIGHGALAERALLPMIPDQERFPYTIHVVSEILSSNGSTSQASICGSTLSLMAAGVPIKKPIAGIAMGLMSDDKNYAILSDIQGLEDHIGDMDFKVAGSTDGITAIQMDIKLKGLPKEILIKALAQAKVGREFILEKMLSCLAEPREALSAFAPKIEQVTVPYDKVGEVIGPAGKVIKDIIAKSGAEVDVETNDEAKTAVVYISSADQQAIDTAKTMVTNIVRVVEVGDEFDATVTRIEGYGAFAEYLPGREGLIHISEMSADYVEDPHSLVQLGDTVHVRVAEIKEDGKIGLSMLSAEEAAAAKNTAAARGARPRPAFRGGRAYGNNDRGGRRDGNRRDNGRSYGRRSEDRNGRNGRGGNGGGFKSQLT